MDIPQAFHLISHLKTQWWSIYQIHRLHQVTLPVEIHFHSQIVSPTQDTSTFPLPLPIDPTSDPCVSPIIIPSAGSSNILLSPVPYVIPNHSPSGPYILPYYIPDTILSPSNVSSMSPSKELYEPTIYNTFSHLILISYSITTTFFQNPTDYSFKKDSTQQSNLYHYYFTPLTNILFGIISSSNLTLSWL